ncbi:GDP-L-fucose synthase family protein [Solirhodobacter olei]|uniref:GDP-L-fucose synthase family protein n=1 Tax=Solirhodobacter olei TaxID=2493082 RepID=UPI000FD91386|nr:GDP-L-fucose synthase [Solirhodobacter olei]
MEKTDRILVTGGRGLVGSAVVEHLRDKGYANVIAIGRQDCDLMDRGATETAITELRPDHIFHAAARVYGIMGNMKNQALSFFENVTINTNVIHAAKLAGTRKITVMGTGAVYPYPSPRLPLMEDDIFLGRPHPAEASYAQAKRAALAMLEAYEDDHGLEWAYVVSCNLFGARDKFDIEFGHVVPSLIAKFHHAKMTGGRVTVWGDGSAQRDFLYVKDCATAIERIMSKGRGTVNIGSGKIYRIRDVVDTLARLTEMEGRLDWDAGKPNGQDYRAYDLSRLSALGFEPKFSLADGLRETWNWYRDSFN